MENLHSKFILSYFISETNTRSLGNGATLEAGSQPQSAHRSSSQESSPTPLSSRTDLLSLPESEMAFVLERLPSPDAPRADHKLFHYRSGADGFELVIAVGGSLVPEPGRGPARAPEHFNANDVSAALDQSRRRVAFEFLDLKRPSRGWVQVLPTDANSAPRELRGDVQFTLSGDSILAFKSTTAFGIDLRYVAEQYAHQLLEVDGTTHNSRESSAPAKPQSQQLHDAQHLKLYLEGARLWRRVTFNDRSGYYFDNQLIFSAALSP